MPKLDTRMIHASEAHPRIAGAVVMPNFQSSTFELGDEAGYHDIRGELPAGAFARSCDIADLRQDFAPAIG